QLFYKLGVHTMPASPVRFGSTLHPIRLPHTRPTLYGGARAPSLKVRRGISPRRDSSTEEMNRRRYEPTCTKVVPFLRGGGRDARQHRLHSSRARSGDH